LTGAGLLLTLSGRLPVVVLGLAVMTAGFFCLHGVASGWVPVRAHAGGVAAGQAASLYLVAYYAGSSIAGSLAGTAWSVGGWDGVVVLSAALISVAGLLAFRLRKVPAIA
jgi:YNFM family putative membrane transporter